MNKEFKTLYVFIVFLIFSAVSVFAQTNTRNYNFTDFNYVSVGSGIKVMINQSNNFKIDIKADQKDLDELQVEKKGDKLVIGFKHHLFNFSRHGEVEATIEMPELLGIDLSGGAMGVINMNESTKNFEVDLSGGAQLGGTLNCGNISMDLSGGSIVKLEGNAGNLSLDGSGGSIFKLKGLSVKDVSADLSGGSQVTITMNGTLNSEQSGGSNLTYYGNAEMGDTDFSGGSSVNKGK